MAAVFELLQGIPDVFVLVLGHDMHQDRRQLPQSRVALVAVPALDVDAVRGLESEIIWTVVNNDGPRQAPAQPREIFVVGVVVEASMVPI